jgi:TfoX/Sxy family transcriptional regulator of competence genes
MAYDEKLADRLREALSHLPKVTEKKMFSGVAFMVNGKMCINVSHDELMCRFDPALFETVVEKPGFRPMVMRGRQLNGYCYISPEGFKSKKDFDFWVNLCLDFNSRAKASKKKKLKSKSTKKVVPKKTIRKKK